MTTMLRESTEQIGLDGAEAQTLFEGELGMDQRSHFRRTAEASINEAHVKEAAELLGQCWQGNRRAIRTVEEIFTTNDFQTAAWVVLDREVISTYQAIEASWQDWMYQTSVRDFRPKKLIDLTQSNMGLLPVAELEPYKEADRSGGKSFDIQVAKYGRLYGFSFESWINDQLDELGDIPQALAQAAADLDAKNAISVLTKGSGPDTGFFKSYSSGPFNGVNTTPATVPLTLDNLDAAVQTLNARIPVDKDRPVVVPRFNLIVPSTLRVAAERIMAIKEIRDTTAGREVVRSNFVTGLVDLKVEPWLTVVDKGAKAAATWYLVPSKDATVKPFAFARLRGHETPDLRVRVDQGQRFGGGDIPANEGSFANDSIEYRVRHINGTAQLDPTYTYVSTGS